MNQKLHGWFGRITLLAAGLCLFAPLALHAQAPAASGTILTIAGNGTPGFSGDGGPATNASFDGLYGLAIGPDGTLYFSDIGNYRIRALNPVTGIITTIAGNGTIGDTGNDGPATDAALNFVITLAVDRARHALYLMDNNNNWVRKVNLTNGLLTRYAGTGIFGFGDEGDGGPATLASLGFPEGISTDGTGRLLIADTVNHRIRQVHPATGIITKLAGNGSAGFSGDGGPAINASLSFPFRVAADRAGNVFVLDGSGTNRIRRIDAVSGLITIVAGGGANVPGTGPATNMNLTGLGDLAVSDDGKLYLANLTRVFVVDLATGQLSPFAGDGIAGFSGDGGLALNARFESITGLTLAPGGGLVISDTGNQRIRYVVPDSINLTNDSGQTAFYLPWASALTGDITVANNPGLTVVNMGALTNVGGDLDISGNAAVAAINMGSVTAVGGDLDLSGNPNAGAINMGATTTVGGDLNMSGNTAADPINMSSLTTVGGDLNLSGNTNAGAINMGATTTVAGDLDISGNTAADPIDMSSLTTVGGDLNLSGNTNTGAINMGATTMVAGDLDISGNTAADPIDMSSLTTVGGDLNLSGNTNAGAINMGSLTTVSGDLTIASNGNNANVNLNSLTNYGCGPNEVTMTLDGGTFSLINGLTLCSNATLAGSSTVDGSITNNGTIKPGRSPGRLNITGGLVLASISKLQLEIGGPAPGQFDLVSVAGNVTPGGTLAVSLIDNFPGVMTSGASFTVLTAGSPLTGAFANVASGATLTTTDGYARFTVLYAGQTSVQLTGLEIVDTDSDGLPDWWEDQFSLDKTNAADAALDLDGDGASNVNEFLARTDPGDPASSFRITQLARAGQNIELTFPTVLGRNYSLEDSITLGAWEPLPGSFPGTGNPLTLSIGPVTGGRYFVRARVGP